MRQTQSNALFDRLPNNLEINNAKQLHDILSSQSSKGKKLELSLAHSRDNVEPITLLPSLVETLLELVYLVSNGRGFTMIPLNSELTTQRTADILNVSREYVIKLLENKEIPYKKKGRHRLIRAEDVFNYKEMRDANRTNELCKLAELDSGLI